MELQKGTIGLDGVQRNTMQISLNDRVSVRVWEGGGSEGAMIPIRKVQLTIDLPSYSNRRQTQIDSSDLVKTVRRCFVDNMLQSKQYLLAVNGGVRLRLRVMALDTPRMDLVVALCMGQHGRLGQYSHLKLLKGTVLHQIADLVWGQVASVHNFVLTRETAVECRAQPNSPINLRQQVRTMFLDKTSQNVHGAIKSRSRLASASPPSQDDENPGATAAMPNVKADATHTVGLKLSSDSAGNVLVSAAAGSGDAAQELLPGDVIESINGQGVIGMGAGKIEALSRGAPGSFVTFGVMRGTQRTFITLERDQPAPEAISSQNTHRPVALFSSASPPRDESGLNGSSISSHEKLLPEGSVSPVVSTSALASRRHPGTPTSQTPHPMVEGDVADDLHASYTNFSSYYTGSEGYSRDSRRNLNTAVEDLAKENRRLRSGLVAQQTQHKELLRIIEQDRKQATLAEHLATGLESQLQVFQQQLAQFHQHFAHQTHVEEHMRHRLRECQDEVARLRAELLHGGGGENLQSPRGEERDSIVRLEEMVETLLTLGEQESTMLNTELNRENHDLKFILAQLEAAESLQRMRPQHPTPSVSAPLTPLADMSGLCLRLHVATKQEVHPTT